MQCQNSINVIARRNVLQSAQNNVSVFVPKRAYCTKIKETVKKFH